MGASGCEAAGEGTPEAPGLKGDSPVSRQSSALRAEGAIVSEAASEGAFALFEAGAAAPLFVSDQDYAGVARAARDLQSDIARVSGAEPTLTMADAGSGSPAVLIGSLNSPLIAGLVQAGKIDLSSLAGKWEAFVIQVVDEPFAGVEQGLVIAGSDKRGTIYGIYELSEEIGVSPWHYWADVPPQTKSQIYVSPGVHTMGEPAVKYRGLFINDEAPALTDWYTNSFGGRGPGFHSAFYAHVFELILRLKGNYLWPAMWGKSFNVDDPENPRLADEYGIVMGTSHHEPLTRSEQEWYDTGHTAEQWSYSTNGGELRSFWQGGAERMADRELLVTVGMRGSGDIPNPDQGIPLMETIVSDQRQILQSATGKNPSEIPQVWTLYKEVQNFYDGGMQVPDDITLMFADDNWGNIRRLPASNGTPRGGGYGIYYHYDYVGGPRSYRWLNTNPIPRVWEQMRLADSLGATQVWIVNVGDLKPMEYPLHFFMDLAWDPQGWTAARLADYPRRWAKAQFGLEHAFEIGHLISQYSKFNGRRKPELLSSGTYNLENFREADTVVEEYNALVTEAKAIEAQLPTEMRDAYYQLVLHPIEACANLNEMYVSQAKNARFASQGRASTNAMAAHVDALFDNDSTITGRYHSVAGGKWNHMMKQTHIGYTGWDHPATQVRPSTQSINVTGSGIGIAVEGSTQAFAPSGAAPTLPELSVYYPDEVRTVEVFNRGTGSVDFTAQSDVAYVTVTPSSGTLGDDTTLTFSVDWAQVPEGESQATVTVSGAGGDVNVQLPLRNPASPRPEEVAGFVEQNGYVSVDASHFTDRVDQAGVGWAIVPDLGRTGNAVHVMPQSAASLTPGGDSPQLHYDMLFWEAGQVQVRVYLSPSLPVHGSHSRYAVSFGDAQPQSVDIHEGLPADFSSSAPVWETWVSDNIIVKSTNHTVQSGMNTLKLWMVDSAVVVQKIVVSRGAPPTSYLGAPTRLPLNVDVEEVVPDVGAPDGPAGTGGATGAGGATSVAGMGGSGSGSGGGPAMGGGGAIPTGSGGAVGGGGAIPTGSGGAVGGGGAIPTGSGGAVGGGGAIPTGSGGAVGGGGAIPDGAGGALGIGGTNPVGAGGTNPAGMGGNSSGTTNPGSTAGSGDDGCSCRTAGHKTPNPWASLGALFALAGVVVRRRRQSEPKHHRAL